MLTPGVSPEQLRGRGWLARAPWGAVGLCPWPLGTFHWFFFMWLTALGQPLPGQSVPRRLCPRLVPPPLPWQRAGRPVSGHPGAEQPRPQDPREGACPPWRESGITQQRELPHTPDPGSPGLWLPGLHTGGRRSEGGSTPKQQGHVRKELWAQTPFCFGVRGAPGPRPASRLKAQAVPSWGLTMSWEPGCPSRPAQGPRASWGHSLSKHLLGTRPAPGIVLGPEALRGNGHVTRQGQCRTECAGLWQGRVHKGWGEPLLRLG